MLEYGSVTVKTPIKYGDIAIFSCEAGRTLIGKKTAFCVGDNKWSQKIPACIDTCEVPRVSKGDVRQLNEDYYSYARYTRFYEDRVESGMSLYVKCEWRYSLIPEANTYEGYRKMTCVDGAWDSEPKCEPKSCEQTPSQLNHGITTFDGLEHGSRIRYSCDPGYTLSYYQNRTCVYGRWTGRKPWCKKNYCSYPKDLPLGMEVMDDSTATRFEHDAILKLQCRKGYRTVHKGISPQLTCYNTTWEINGNLQCESEPCFYEAKRFEEVISQTYTEDGKLSHNSTLEIRCKYPRRFHLKDGVSKARCHYGEWQPRVPSCEAESCELLESITHGRIIYSDDDTARVTKRVPHQATAKLVCDMGYRIAKNNMTHCVYGRWSPSSALACDPESCQGYDDLGRAGGYPASDGDIRQVFCPRGYHIDKLTIDGEFLYTRNVTAECSLGEWRPMVPECKPDPCKLPSWGNVDMRYENGTGDVDVIVSHDINVTFSCVDGYVWENETTDITDLSLSCQSGEWIGPLPPKCIPDGTGCLDPGDIQNANKTNVRIADNGYYPSGELLTYECHKGFLVDGMIRNQEIFCLGNGTWSDSLFNCTALTCDKPESIKDGSYSPVKELYFFNESVTYSCENPKTVSGSEILTCTEDGQWNKWKPECKVPKCPDLPWPEKGRRVGSGRQVGDIVSFECNAGYSVHGSKARTCQTNKEWSGEITTCVADLDQCVIPKEGKDVRSVYHDVGKHSLDVRMGDRVKEGTVMLSRCERFTDMYFIGDPKRVCEHGQWIGVEPKCTYTYLTEGAYSRRYYHEVSRPARGISISDEGHLEVRKGSTVILTCQFGEEQVWSSMKGLHSAEMVEKPVEYYADGGRKIVSSKLRITDADSHHSDTYFCSRSRRSIPTGTFTITVT
ncbi:sushi, von Willebrand factor type A, EGF and pentraxin domain-containing protein 1-like [Liolophura sinensis]|uniref:sushi, von Willebrand factor type A, EGF and pentraxin domain-containing protein 1-like n=1 Tax=Liolophura sinensis TaxID=3198878 RepID=UPI003158960C